MADQLDQLKLNYAFVGGSIVNLLLDDPSFLPARPTDDVDVVLEVVMTERYSTLEERIRRLGFEHDTREGAPLCRWVLGHPIEGEDGTDSGSLRDCPIRQQFPIFTVPLSQELGRRCGRGPTPRCSRRCARSQSHPR